MFWFFGTPIADAALISTVYGGGAAVVVDPVDVYDDIDDAGCCFCEAGKMFSICVANIAR